jgi:phosphotransferase family enzyme
LNEPGAGHFSRSKLDEALREVCAVIGADHRDARLLRLTNNAVYRLAHVPVVVRIVASRALEHRVGKVVRIACWLQDNDVPAVRLLAGFEQPIRVDGYLATAWDFVPSADCRPTGRDLAELLVKMHSLAIPAELDLPSWAPLDAVRNRVGEAEALDPGDREFLLERCEQVERRLAELEFPRPWRVVHGDAHLGNVIPSADGPVLCDFDSSGVGPAEWDMVPVAVGVLRFGEPVDTYRQMVDTYGLDVTTWSGFQVLREVRELKLTTSVLPIMTSHPEVRPQLLRRLQDFRDGNTDATWERYR